jgi:hypothetical protein
MHTYSMSCVILELRWSGVDVPGPRPLAVEDVAELSDVDDKVRLRSMPFRVIASKSSKKRLEDGSVNPKLSERMSYSLVQLITQEPSYSLKFDASSCCNGICKISTLIYY